MVYCYSDFVLQGRRFRVVYKGVLGLGLLMAYLLLRFFLARCEV
jgi:hypothetical protein